MDALSVVRHDRQVPPAILDVLRSLGVRDPHALYSLAARLPATDGVGEDAAHRARVVLGERFARLLDRPDLDPEQAFVIGRAAFVAVDGGGRCPTALMDNDPPMALIDAMRRSVPPPCPPAAPTPMAIQSLDPPPLLAPLRTWLRGARVKRIHST